MSKLLKLIGLSLIGGLTGFLIWLAFYLANKTPAIEFDGPAGAGMIASAGLGFIVFGLAGIVLSATKKL